jgi:hypothetical protein
MPALKCYASSFSTPHPQSSIKASDRGGRLRRVLFKVRGSALVQEHLAGRPREHRFRSRNPRRSPRPQLDAGTISLSRTTLANWPAFSQPVQGFSALKWDQADNLIDLGSPMRNGSRAEPHQLAHLELVRHLSECASFMGSSCVSKSLTDPTSRRVRRRRSGRSTAPGRRLSSRFARTPLRTNT